MFQQGDEGTVSGLGFGVESLWLRPRHSKTGKAQCVQIWIPVGPFWSLGFWGFGAYRACSL